MKFIIVPIFFAALIFFSPLVNYSLFVFYVLVGFWLVSILFYAKFFRLKGLLIIFLILVIGMRYGMNRIIRVQGASMNPNFKTGDLVLYSSFIKEIQRGDVVVFKMPNKNTIGIKRVIGLNGDEISFKYEELRINNKLMNLQKVNFPKLRIDKNIPTDVYRYNLNNKNIVIAKKRNSQVARRTQEVVEPGKLYLMGDQWTLSQDSRYYGAVAASHLMGVVVYRLSL